MRLRPLLLLLTFVFLAALALLWSPWDSQSAPPPPDQRPGAAGPQATGTTAEESSGPDEQARVPLPASTILPEAIDDDFFGWIGTVTLPDGTPAIDAVVDVFAYPVVRSFRTDDAGRFRAEWSEPTPWDDHDSLTAVHQGYWARRVRGVAPARPAAKVGFQLAEGLPVEVEVVDQRTGEPVAGVRVYVYQTQDLAFGETGEDGRLRLHAPRPGVVRVGVDWGGSANGGEQQERLVGPGRPVPKLRFEVLPYPERVSLLAVDAVTGDLLEDTRYSMVPRGAAAAADGFPQLVELLSAGGLLRYDAPAEERPVVVLVEAPGFRARNVFVAQQGAEPLRVPLERAENIRARVTVRGETPSGPCRIRWIWRPSEITLPDDPELESGGSGFRPDGHVRGQAVTDELGYTELPFRPGQDRFPDFPHFTVEGPDGLSRFFGIVNAEMLGEEPWVFELDPDRATVEIRARNVAGEPVADIDVTVEILRWKLDDPWGMANFMMNDKALLVGLAARGRTGTDGVLRLEVLAGAGFEWEASIPGHQFKGRVAEPLQRDEVRVVEIVPPGPESTIAGRVFFADGRPADRSTGIALWAKDSTGRMPVNTRIANDGGFRLTGLAPGSYRIGYGAPPIGPALGEIEAITGTDDLQIHLPPLHDLVLRPVDAVDRRPLEGFEFEYQARDWSGSRSSTGSLFILPHYARLWDSVTVWGDGYLPKTVDLRPLSDEQRADLEIRLERARTIHLSLRDARGEAADWYTLLRLPEEEGAEAEEPGDWVGDDDSWIWRSAPKTALRLQFVDEDGKALSAVIEIPPGADDRSLDIPLQEAADG